MKKHLVCMMAVAVIAAAIPALAMDAPSEPLKLAYFPNKIVMYPHSAHTKFECGTCHHQLDADGNPIKCTTSGCHDVFNKRDKSVNSLYKIIHGRKTETEGMQTCLQCHKDVAKESGDRALKRAITGCSKSKCHP